MRRDFPLTIVCALLLGMILIGCGAGEKQTVDQGEAQTETQEEAAAAGTAPSSPEWIAVDTDYGTLYFPNQWEEFVQTDQTVSGETLTVSFDAVIQNTAYPLFEVTIGGTEGTRVGELTDADGTKRPVYMNVNEIEETPSLTPGEQDRLFAMQEDLNYLVDHLK